MQYKTNKLRENYKFSVSEISLVWFKSKDELRNTGVRTRMERFAEIFNGLKLLTIFAKHAILDECRVLNTPLHVLS